MEKKRVKKKTIKTSIKKKSHTKSHTKTVKRTKHATPKKHDAKHKTPKKHDTKQATPKKHDTKPVAHSKIKVHRKKEEKILTQPVVLLILAVVVLMAFNQYQITTISKMVGGGRGSRNSDLGAINIDEIKSTGHTLAAVFPVEDIVTPEDAMAILFPTGTPEYGPDLGVSYDDPIGSLEILAKMYPGLMAEVKKSNPEAWEKYMNLATKPVGISCEYCCGLKAIGIRNDGSSSCGCQHNPALLSIALYLSAYTDYSDGEILREVMSWKILFFPKNMIELGMTVAGGDISSLEDLPGMVGGC